jgi:hypothetical protein
MKKMQDLTDSERYVLYNMISFLEIESIKKIRKQYPKVTFFSSCLMSNNTDKEILLKKVLEFYNENKDKLPPLPSEIENEIKNL